MKKIAALLLTVLLYSCTNQLYVQTNAPFDTEVAHGYHTAW